MDNDTPNSIGKVIRNTNWQLSSDLENQIMKEVNFISSRRKQIKRDRTATLWVFSFAMLFGLILNFIPEKYIPVFAELSSDTIRLVFQFAWILLLLLFLDSYVVARRSYRASVR